MNKTASVFYEKMGECKVCGSSNTFKISESEKFINGSCRDCGSPIERLKPVKVPFLMRLFKIYIVA